MKKLFILALPLLLAGCAEAMSSEESTIESSDSQVYFYEEVKPQAIESSEESSSIVAESTSESSEEEIEYNYNLYKDDVKIYSGDTIEFLNYMTDPNGFYTLELKVFDLVGEELFDAVPEYGFTFNYEFPEVNHITIKGYYYETGDLLIDGYFTKASVVIIPDNFNFNNNFTFINCEIRADNINLNNHTLNTAGTYGNFVGSGIIANGNIICDTVYETDFTKYAKLENLNITLNKGSIWIYGKNTEVMLNKLIIDYCVQFTFVESFTNIFINNIEFTSEYSTLKFTKTNAPVEIVNVHGDKLNYLAFETFNTKPNYINFSGNFDMPVELIFTSGIIMTINHLTGEVEETKYEEMDFSSAIFKVNNPDFLSLLRDEININNELYDKSIVSFNNNELFINI